MGGKVRQYHRNPDVGRWKETIESIRSRLGLSDQPGQGYPTHFVLSIIHLESSGNPYAQNKIGYTGLTQIGAQAAETIGLKNYKAALKGDGPLAIEAFFRHMEEPYMIKAHQYDYGAMAVAHNLGHSRGRKFRKIKEEKGSQAALNYLKNNFGSTRRAFPINLANAMKVWAGFTGESIEQVDDYSGLAISSDEDTIFGGETAIRHMTPFELGSYVTPEELRKGIIAQIYYINEWHLIQQAQNEAQEVQDEKDQEVVQSLPENASLREDKKSSAPLRASGLVDQRRRYAQSLVDAEFYRRRYASRSVPAITGPFNPYPVSGFSGLIMNPGRPILGYVTNITHQINVGAATGTTGVTMTQPRYWDEGEVWYWYGGEPSENQIMRKFPQWQNRATIASNNYDPDGFDRRSHFTPLDRYYQFMIGSNAIAYESNNKGKVSPEKIEDAIKNRNPSDLEINPETMELLEYNRMIADTDESGRFAPGTLAHHFFGPIKPFETVENTIPVEEQIDFAERYGVRERELLEDFLGNKFRSVNGRVVVMGPTFGGDQLNSIQSKLIEYMDDLEKRSLDGGV